jgi:uncharacterized protein YraI
MMRKLLVTTTLAALTMAGAASAQTTAPDMAAAGAPTTATAATDLNLRSGPQSTAPIVGVIANGDEVSVTGCIESANWCQVTYKDQQGWAYGDYLTAQVGNEPQPLYPNRQAVGVTVIQTPAENPREGQNTAVGAAGGAAMGAAVGGPVGALVGAAIGGTTGNVATPEPPPEVRTYITANPQQPVILDGEVVVGAGIPESVTLYDIPGQPDYRYVVVNEQPVLVNADRRIVYVYR